MTIWQWWPYVSAVIVGNAVSFLFFMAAMKCSRLQKNGVKDEDLPLWVWVGLLVAPATGAVGVALLS